MRLFHATTLRAARIIRDSGFRNARGSYGLVDEQTGRRIIVEGVFLADRILTCSEGVSPDATAYFRIVIPGKLISRFEWIEEGKGYREWCVPANIVNRHFQDRTIRSC
jgi:hypothetical protein